MYIHVEKLQYVQIDRDVTLYRAVANIYVAVQHPANTYKCSINTKIYE